MVATHWSKNWKKSKKPSKQRKYVDNGPLHLKHKLIHVHLSKELRERYGKRSLGVRKGDTVKVLRGQHRKKSNKVSRVDLKNLKVYIEGIEKEKKEGMKSAYPFNPSNLMITELFEDDRFRMKRLKEIVKKTKKSTKEKNVKDESKNKTEGNKD